MVGKGIVLAVAGLLVFAPAALAKGPVPSLTPAATQKLWRSEVARARHAAPRAAADDCRPARVVFYAQTDWLRLATRLAANASPCAQYYISIPPLAATKTQPRSGQAAQIRALGANFHAADEINWNGWNAWVAANGATWYDAGVQARQLMAAAGFDTGAGDTWALNELSSAVRTGAGPTRGNVEAFLQGLGADGVKGIVFAAGIGQTSSTATYKLNLQSWFQDTGFWTQASQDVSDWAQENYGDVRAYAVVGSTPQQRRDAEVQFLGHQLALAAVAPPEAAVAAAFLRSAYSAFGNAAWAWSSSYGYTATPVETMQDFVSGQVYADRSLGAPSGVDRFGFAWAPQNSLGLSAGDFAAQTQAVLDRIAAAIHDTGVPADDPGAPACAPSWCATSVDGAAFTPNWQTFSTWSVPGLVFTTAPTTFAAGASIPLTVQLQSAGIPQSATTPQTVTFTTTSAGGGFATSAQGPFTTTLAATIPAGVSSATVYYRDTVAGTPTVSAALPGQAAVATTETVTPGALAKLSVAAASVRVTTGARVPLTATATDAFGNAVTATPTWTASAGTVKPSGMTATFVAPANAGKVTVAATVGSVRATATLTVTLAPARVAKVATRWVAGHLVVTTWVVRAAAPAPNVGVTVRVRKGSSTIAVVKGTTGARGTFVWRSRTKLPRGRYVAKAAIRSASTASRTQQSGR